LETVRKANSSPAVALEALARISHHPPAAVVRHSVMRHTDADGLAVAGRTPAGRLDVE